MNIRSIKQVAEEQNVSYEAIRKQIVRYSDDLKDHIIRKNRTQYLDDWAVDFLKEKRKENPIVLMNMDRDEQIEELTAQVDLLKSKLLVAQDQIINLQEESKKLIEDRGKYFLLLDESKVKEEKLKEAEDQVTDYKKVTEQLRKTMEDLRGQYDEAQKEAQSFKRTIFGFYRKV